MKKVNILFGLMIVLCAFGISELVQAETIKVKVIPLLSNYPNTYRVNAADTPEIQIDSNKTIEDLKKAISDTLHIPVAEQCIFFCKNDNNVETDFFSVTRDVMVSLNDVVNITTKTNSLICTVRQIGINGRDPIIIFLPDDKQYDNHVVIPLFTLSVGKPNNITAKTDSYTDLLPRVRQALTKFDSTKGTKFYDEYTKSGGTLFLRPELKPSVLGSQFSQEQLASVPPYWLRAHVNKDYRALFITDKAPSPQIIQNVIDQELTFALACDFYGLALAKKYDYASKTRQTNNPPTADENLNLYATNLQLLYYAQALLAFPYTKLSDQSKDAYKVVDGRIKSELAELCNRLKTNPLSEQQKVIEKLTTLTPDNIPKMMPQFGQLCSEMTTEQLQTIKKALEAISQLVSQANDVLPSLADLQAKAAEVAAARKKAEEDLAKQRPTFQIYIIIPKEFLTGGLDTKSISIAVNSDDNFQSLKTKIGEKIEGDSSINIPQDQLNSSDLVFAGRSLDKNDPNVLATRNIQRDSTIFLVKKEKETTPPAETQFTVTIQLPDGTTVTVPKVTRDMTVPQFKQKVAEQAPQFNNFTLYYDKTGASLTGDETTKIDALLTLKDGDSFKLTVPSSPSPLPPTETEKSNFVRNAALSTAAVATAGWLAYKYKLFKLLKYGYRELSDMDIQKISRGLLVNYKGSDINAIKLDQYAPEDQKRIRQELSKLFSRVAL